MDERSSVPTLYVPSEEDFGRVNNIFIFHPVHGNQAQRYEYLRSVGKMLAHDILAMTPKSREQSVAITKLQEVIMWANAAIAINEKSEENK